MSDTQAPSEDPVDTSAECTGAESSDNQLELHVKWNSQSFTVRLDSDVTVAELKDQIYEKTGVLAKRQKLLNVRHQGKPAGDDVRVRDCVKPGSKVMVLGTVEKELQETEAVAAVQEAMSTVVDDLDIADADLFSKEDELVPVHPDNVRKLREKSSTYKFEIRTPPRDGTKLLVLDIDYTLFDHRSPAENARQLMRPFLHEFLTRAYVHYDIIIWSATSMSWVKLKMQELGVLDNPNYNVVALMDSAAMISVETHKYGILQCKPLGVIWANFGGRWSNKNTIMFDDLRRNFVMNPQSGLKVRPYKNAFFNYDRDRELRRLTRYLEHIATFPDFSVLEHREWERYARKRPR